MTRSNSPPKSTEIPVDHAFVCNHCDHRWYYTRSRCPECKGDVISTYELTEGKLVARTDVAVTPPDVRSPNSLGLARFGEVRLLAQLADDISIGSRVTFAGEYRLRNGDETTKPRLQVVE